ncbi:hypothetical protein RP20_CCG011034 [Aedes albopictus]|nr:hypothetical protein RP20_CCG011034 [Aedes albopictus]
MKTIALLVVFACAGVYQCNAQVKAKIPLTLTGNADGSVLMTLGTGSVALSVADFSAVRGVVGFTKSVFNDVTTGTTQTYSIPVTLNVNGTVNLNLKGNNYVVAPATLSALLQQLQQSLAPFAG